MNHIKNWSHIEAEDQHFVCSYQYVFGCGTPLEVEPKVPATLITVVSPAESNTLEEEAAVIRPSQHSQQAEEGCVKPIKDILVEHQ